MAKANPVVSREGLDIIKTWPAFMDARTVYAIFRVPQFARYFFTLGRGCPNRPVNNLWFTYKGRILGRFEIAELVINDGSLPKLNRLDGEESSWQIKPDRWVAVCNASCMPLIGERLYMAGFRGWRYFNVESYRKTMEARMRT